MKERTYYALLLFLCAGSIAFTTATVFSELGKYREDQQKYYKLYADHAERIEEELYKARLVAMVNDNER